MRKFTILIFVALLFSSVYAIEGQFDPQRLNGRGINEITYELTNQYLSNGNQTIYFQTRNGLKVFFTGNQFFLDNLNYEADSNVLGLYVQSENAIFINSEKIITYAQNLSLDENETLLLIQNVILHELTHYADYTGKIDSSIFINSYNLSYSNYPTLDSNTIQWIQLLSNQELPPLNTTPTDIPFYLQETIDFSDIFYNRGYVQSQYGEEVIARITALCFQQKTSYTYYWEMIESSDYKFCDNFNFDPNFDNFLNVVVTDFVEGYIIAFDLQTLESSTYVLPEIGGGIGGFISRLSDGVTIFILAISLIVVVSGILFLVVQAIKSIR